MKRYEGLTPGMSPLALRAAPVAAAPVPVRVGGGALPDYKGMKSVNAVKGSRIKRYEGLIPSMSPLAFCTAPVAAAPVPVGVRGGALPACKGMKSVNAVKGSRIKRYEGLIPSMRPLAFCTAPVAAAPVPVGVGGGALPACKEQKV